MHNESVSRLRELVIAPGPAELGPQRRSTALASAALEAELNAIFQALPVPAKACELVRALLLLWHDHLDAAHAIAQSIENRDGSLVHAIMHRREPDYWNSKYWWRRVGEHPCFGGLGTSVAEFLRQRSEVELAGRLVPGGRWDAFAFVDECEAVAGARLPQREDLLRAIQQIETQVVLQEFLGTDVPLDFALP